MTFSEDLQRLADLHQRGKLTDDEFQRAKARLLDAPHTADGGPTLGGAQAAINALQRSRSDRWLGGVCGGIAQVTGIAAWFWRLLFVLLATCAGTGILLYALGWLLLPEGDGAGVPSPNYRPY